MTSSTNISGDVKNGLRFKKVNAKYFTFKWKNDNDESTSDKTFKNDDNNANDDNGKYGFFKSIKKKLSIKKLCKSKRKISTVELPKEVDEGASSDRVATADEKHELEVNERVGMPSNDSEKDLRMSSRDFPNKRGNSMENDRHNHSQIHGSTENPPDNVNNENTERLDPSEVKKPENSDEIDKNSENYGQEEEKGNLSNLSQELLKLSKYGWYWGPISGDEADAKLQSEPDGAFLIRDSSDDRYLLTLSFKSAGKLLHARVEHSGGMFSLCNQGDNGRFSSVPALIDHSMNFSKSAVFCYSRPKYPGCPAFPVRLTKPVSRFTQVRSLQYLCRFVIRQNTRLDNIHKLPLPKTIKGYIEEAHY